MQLWQAGNYSCFLSLHLFACLSLNYQTGPTVPVKSQATERPPHGSYAVLQQGMGVALTFPWHVFMLRWTDMLSWSICRRTRARKSGILLLAGPIQDFRMCCSRLLSLTGGCNSHREECKNAMTFIGPPTLVQCFGQSWRLTCIIVVAVHFLLQARVKLRIKGCDLEKCPKLT